MLPENPIRFPLALAIALVISTLGAAFVIGDGGSGSGCGGMARPGEGSACGGGAPYAARFIEPEIFRTHFDSFQDDLDAAMRARR